MDFDDAKENIQPLAAGRNASILQAALHAESHQELQQQRRQYEDAIKNYEGSDPLEPWFEYIYWIEQSFPSGGKESGLEEVLLKCLTKFEKDEHYHQDRRMIKLYIKYIDTHENPQECYQQLYNQGIGTMVADLYICWAYYYDLSGNFRKADQIFRKGIECRAQPLEELQEAHQHFGFTMSQRILYDDDKSKQKYQSTLHEKRQALTSLKSHGKKVGSVRTGTAVKSYAPGKVQLNSTNSTSSFRGGNSNVHVFEDENRSPNVIPSVEAAPDTSKSVVKTLLDSARKQENVKEPGPWNKAHDKKKGKLFPSEPRTDLGFEILEDDRDLQPIKGRINYGKPFIYVDGFVARNEPQEEWNLPVTLENEQIPRSYPSYDKCMLYPRPNLEFSPEELRGYRWYKGRNIDNNFTRKYALIWKSDVNTGVRMYPNFARKNQPITEEPRVRTFNPLDVNVKGESKLVFNPKLCYPSEEEEMQFEEVMYHSWKNGERKLKYGGNETIALTEEMEETICLPREATRRKSFFPTRKSIAPTQFVRTSPLDQDIAEEDEPPRTPVPRRSVIVKTPKKDDKYEPGEPKVPIQVYEDEDNDSAEFAFKTPAAPSVRQQKLNFQIYEEEENNYEANETCSTQVFNCFLKAQSVSTPKAANKVMKLTPTKRQAPNLNVSGIENVPVQVNQNLNPIAAFSPPEYNDAGLTLQCKQLSTIMETSEQITGNTASTKSSTSSQDFEIEGQQSRIPLTNNVCNLETVQEAGSLAEKDSGEVLLMKSLRLDKEEDPPTLRQHNEISRLEEKEDTVSPMPAVKIFEDKTETVSKILIAKCGNFSRIENREDTTPSIKPVKFHEDKTETISKILLAPRKPAINEIPPDDEMFDFFTKSPEKQVVAPSAPSANKSKFSASAFMNFQDSPVSKLRCNYESPELRAKCSSLVGMKKPSNLSFLPNFDDEGEKKEESSFRPDFSANFSIKLTREDSNLPGSKKEFSSGGSLRRLQSKEDSLLGNFSKDTVAGGVLHRKESKEDSIFPGFSREISVGGSTLPIQKSTEDSFLSGFPSVTAGINKPREESFMSHLSNVRAPKAKQDPAVSFMKQCSSGGGDDKPREAIDWSHDSLMNFSSAAGDGKSKKAAKISMVNSFMPNLSTADELKQKVMPTKGITQDKSDLFRMGHKVTDESFMPNLSTTLGGQNQNQSRNISISNATRNGAGESYLKSTSKIQDTTNPADDVPIKDLSVRGCSRIPKLTKDAYMNQFPLEVEHLPSSSKISFLREQTKSPSEKVQKTCKVSFLKPSEDSFKSDIPKSPSQQPSKVSFLKPKNTSINEAPQRSDRNHSQSSCSLSFFNSFSSSEPKKQPEQPETFAIFEDSNCQKAAPVLETKTPNNFTIFEDSHCQKRSSISQGNKNNCFDVSLKPDDFFEDNIRTDAFAANLSMIKNSTWLPNHGPRQSQINMQSIHIKDEIHSPSTPHHGLSIFSSIPQENSVDLMPPPLPQIGTKVPLKPIKAPLVISPSKDCIVISESEDEDMNENLGKSIYYTKTPKTPKIVRHTWSPESDQQSPKVNNFIHRKVDLNQTNQIIDDFCEIEDVNPFRPELMEAFLIQIDFTNFIEKLPTCDMVRNVKQLKKDTTIGINGNNFHVLKFIGEGSYGAVYCAKEQHSGQLYALKQERPPNFWEYYICLELRSRLNSNEILAGFVNIECALIGNNAGILVSKFSRYGSLITVCNKIKKETLKNVDEYVVMHMASQLLLIMDHLHASNIIHADVKPDNFLLMEKLVPGRKQPTIQLIDFGSSIDMDLFKKGQTFRYTHESDSFKCVEMHEKRPWTYQLDLFGLAGVIHVLLFGKYMEIVKTPSGWTHRSHVPRYFKKFLWQTIFHSLLNIPDCQTMPNLQNLRAQLEEEIAENDKSVYQKIVEFNRALDL